MSLVGDEGEDLNSSRELGSSLAHNINKKLSFTRLECPTPRAAALSRQKVGEPLQVFLRVRPLVADDTDSEECIQQFGDSVELNAPLDSAAAKNGEMKSRLTFSKVMGPDATQAEVYQATAAPLVEAMLEGQSGLLFAYGITNSGKTFTIQGKEGNEGIIPRVVTQLLTLVDKTNSSFFVTVSFVEIYNEKIFDLLEPTLKGPGRKACALRNTGHDRVVVVGAKEVLVSNVQEAMGVVQQGIANRCVDQTLLNADSSRSHSVFTVTLLSEDRVTVWSRLSVCDLAGAERMKRTEHNTGKGIKEASNINLSLMVLARCLDILRQNQKMADPLRRQVVPFRDSVLTRLFRDSLMGWGRTVMIANANPQACDFDETIHALKYAAIARDITIQPRVDTRRPTAQALQISQDFFDDDGFDGPEADHEEEIDNYLDQIFQLKSQLVECESRLAMAEKNIRAEVCNEMEQQQLKTEQEWLDRMEMTKISMNKKLENKLKLYQFEIQSGLTPDEGSRANSALLVERKMHEVALERSRAEHEVQLAALNRKIAELEQTLTKQQEQALVASPVPPPPKAEPDEAVLSQLTLLESKLIEADKVFSQKQKDRKSVV